MRQHKRGEEHRRIQHRVRAVDRCIVSRMLGDVGEVDKDCCSGNTKELVIP